MKALVVKALLLYQLFLFHCCASQKRYRKLQVPSNQFCRIHIFSAASNIECAATCQIKEDGGDCTAYRFDLLLEDSCECGQSPCFESSNASDISPISILVNAKCDRFKDGKTWSQSPLLQDCTVDQLTVQKDLKDMHLLYIPEPDFILLAQGIDQLNEEITSSADKRHWQ